MSLRVPQIHWLIFVASTSSSCALFACVLFLPRLYHLIEELNEEVDYEVSGFRVETDKAWEQLMMMQLRINR